MSVEAGIYFEVASFYSFGCSTEISRDQLQEGCYTVQWLENALKQSLPKVPDSTSCNAFLQQRCCATFWLQGMLQLAISFAACVTTKFRDKLHSVTAPLRKVYSSAVLVAFASNIMFQCRVGQLCN